MKKRPAAARVALLVAAVLAAVLLFRWADEFIAVDRCLDRAGRWDASAGACEGAAVER